MVQYPVYMERKQLFFFAKLRFYDMMKMVYFMDISLDHFI